MNAGGVMVTAAMPRRVLADAGGVIPAFRLQFGSGLSVYTAPTRGTGLAEITANSGGVTSTITLPISCHF